MNAADQEMDTNCALVIPGTITYPVRSNSLRTKERPFAQLLGR